MKFDFREISIPGGLALLGHGLYLKDPSLCYIVVGALVFVFSVLSLCTDTKGC